MIIVIFIRRARNKIKKKKTKLIYLYTYLVRLWASLMNKNIYAKKKTKNTSAHILALARMRYSTLKKKKSHFHHKEILGTDSVFPPCVMSPPPYV